MRETSKSFEDLIVWQKAHKLVLAIYKISEVFPKHEMYGLTSQIRRAAVSIAANIAEGFRKKTKVDKARYLNISQGSAEEVRYYLILINDLGYAEVQKLTNILNEVSKLLYAYRNAILSSVS